MIDYYATLSLHSVNELVTFNFGAKPFKFDIEKLRKEEQTNVIQGIVQQEVHPFDVYQIVYSYLLFNGYADTLNAFKENLLLKKEKEKEMIFLIEDLEDDPIEGKDEPLV